jgi:hypothetical protein
MGIISLLEPCHWRKKVEKEKLHFFALGYLVVKGRKIEDKMEIIKSWCEELQNIIVIIWCAIPLSYLQNNAKIKQCC